QNIEGAEQRKKAKSADPLLGKSNQAETRQPKPDVAGQAPSFQEESYPENPELSSEEALPSKKAALPPREKAEKTEAETEVIKSLEKEGLNITQIEDEERPKMNLRGKVGEQNYRSYGAWQSGGKKPLTPTQRRKANADTYKILNKDRAELTQADIDTLRQYSGFGGIEGDDSKGERGVLYDYYTDPETAFSLHKLANRLRKYREQDSKILEPSCGTGVFIETTPDDIHSITGVELDPRTASVADILQGHKANIENLSFEQFNLSTEKGQFTHVIGNVPFGKRSAGSMTADMPDESKLDNYFLLRSMDNLEANGVLCMIAASGPLTNKFDREFRLNMLRKGRFQGAYRIPNTSFKHADTSVSPVVYLFQKHPPGYKELEHANEEQLRNSGIWHDDFIEGKYLEANDHAILGERAKGNFDADTVEGEWNAQVMEDWIDSHERIRYSYNDDVIWDIITPEVKESHRTTFQEAKAIEDNTLLVGQIKTIGNRVYRLNDNHRWELVKDP
ncbi:MAG: N-6 DNA methylase, partial [Spirochaetota bacterium]